MSQPIRIDADVKLDSKVLTDVAEALEPHADTMFRQRRGRWVAVVELAHVERVEPGPDEDKAPAVKVRVTSLEIAPDVSWEATLRQLMNDLYRRRTSDGTLDAAA